MTTDKLKIAIVLGHTLPFPPLKGGGIETINFSLAKQFAALGHEVTCYSRANGTYPAEEVDAFGIRHIRVAGSDRAASVVRDLINDFAYSVRVWRALRDCDVVMLNIRWAFLAGLFIRKALPVYTIQRTPKWTVWLFGGLARIYCPSRAVEDAARAIRPGMRNLAMIYNCVDVAAQSAPELAAPKPAGAPLFFLYVGRFVRDKGLASLTKGFALSRDRFPANRLETLGPQTAQEGADPAFLTEMKSYVATQALEDHVAFLPPIYDKTELVRKMREADVICVPTITGETFSSAVLEAMSLGRPVLVSDFGPMPEAVEDGKTGKICRTDDAQSIAKGMEFLSENRALLPEMGRAALEKVRTDFSAGKIASEYIEDFRRLVAQRG